MYLPVQFLDQLSSQKLSVNQGIVQLLTTEIWKIIFLPVLFWAAKMCLLNHNAEKIQPLILEH